MPRTNFSYNQPETRDAGHETIALLSALRSLLYASALNLKLQTLNVFLFALCSRLCALSYIHIQTL